MDELETFAAVPEPTAAWQWAGIVGTIAGALLSAAAAWFAAFARREARRAARRVGGLNALVRLEEVRFELQLLDRAVSERDCPSVAASANRLRLAVARLPSAPGTDWTDAGRTRVLAALGRIVDIAARAGSRPVRNQLIQLRVAVGEVAEAIGTTSGRFEAALGTDDL